MKKQIIQQDSFIEPIVETHYICPVKGCDRDLGAITYDEALKHVNQKGFELPIGLVLGESILDLKKAGRKPREFKYYTKIRDSAEELDERHNIIYNTIYFDIHDAQRYRDKGAIAQIPYYSFNTLSAPHLIRKDLSLLTEKEFDIYLDLVKVVAASKDHKSIVPVRTTPEVEEMIARMRKENKR